MEPTFTPVNVIAVLADARSVSGQHNGWKKAAEAAVRWATDGFYTDHGKCPVIAVYMSDGKKEAKRYTIDELQYDLAHWGVE